MIDNSTPLATLIERVEDYSKTTIELFKLHAIDKSADVVSSLVSRLAIIMSVSLSILIINIGIALWLGTLLGNAYFGFFIMGGFYSLISIILHVFRYKLLKFPVSNSVIKQMLKEKRK